MNSPSSDTTWPTMEIDPLDMHLVMSLQNLKNSDPERTQEHQVLSSFQSSTQTLPQPVLSTSSLSDPTPLATKHQSSSSTGPTEMDPEMILIDFEADIKLIIDCQMDLLNACTQLHRKIMDKKSELVMN